MKSKSSKLLIAWFLFVFTSSTALATIELSSRSEEMVANSTCDQAGSIELAFDEDDYTLISDYLSDNDYVRIRVTLTGTDIEASATPPFLCEAISGAADVSGLGLPEISNEGDGYIAIDMEGFEVSNFSGTADMTAYVYGADGKRYFDIFITDMVNPLGLGYDDQVWIRIGLYNELLEVDPTEDDTAICVNVEDFSGLSKLTCSYNFTPTSLSINSSDNEIGHFLENDFTLRNLNENSDCSSITDVEKIGIILPEIPEGECELTTNGDHAKYMVLEGDYPADGNFSIVIRTNGAGDGDVTQNGVYIAGVTLYNEYQDDCLLETITGYDYEIYDADGQPAEDIDGDGQPCTFYNTEKVVLSGIATDDIAALGAKVIIRVSYFVVEEMVAIGEQVSFWVEAMTEPCGNMADGTLLGALIVAPISDTEREALIALYNSANGDSWIDNSGWKTPPLDVDGFALPGTESGWYGVTNPVNTVIELNLDSNQLNGSIPGELGNLSNLTSLDLSFNQLSGSIPEELSDLSYLNDLDLCFNQLSGYIPTMLGLLNNLTILDLSFNQLSGSIPAELGSLTNLTLLDLSFNQLTGSIPEELGDLINLTSLDLSLNQLTGSIPAELGNLSNLIFLYLHNNQLSGSIPEEIGNLSNLKNLVLRQNELSGKIPATLTNLAGLIYLNISYNHLYATDQDLLDFLDSFQPGWDETQTPPLYMTMPHIPVLLLDD